MIHTYCSVVGTDRPVVQERRKTTFPKATGRLSHPFGSFLRNCGAAVIGLLTTFAHLTAHADFPALIDVVTDTAELSEGPDVTIDGEWVASRPMGDLDGDGLGDRIIEIAATDNDQCPGVAILPSSLNVGFDFTRAELSNLVRITDQEIVESDGDISCKYRNLRVFTEPRRLGDINGDGLIDLVINISGIFDNVPRVILGTTTPGTEINLDELNGSNGFAVVGNGHIVFPVGDVNGDGYTDIGHQDGRTDFIGVVAGRASYGSLLDVSTQSSEQQPIGLLRLSSLRGLGDIDGDGFDDLVAFPSGREPFRENQIPRIIYGAADLALSSLEDQNTRVVRMLEECGTRQCSIYPVGDIDGDGIDDVLASQRFEASNLPPRSVIYGRAGGLVVRNEITEFPDGERTRLVTEGNGPIGDRGAFYRGGFNDTYLLASGQRVDFDGDGIDDLLLRQNVAPSRQGWYALFGTPGFRPPVRSLADADGLLGVAFDLGTALSPITSASPPEIGDLDRDGIDDFIWTWRRNVPFVSGRSRDINGLNVTGLGVRRSPSELTLFWDAVQGVDSYSIEFDNRFIDEVGADTTEFTVGDDIDGAAVRVQVVALDRDGVVLSTQSRQVPLFTPIADSVSITVYGKDLLEVFVTQLRDEFDRSLGRRFLVVRDGQIVGRTPGGSFTDATVQPGQTYSYQLISDEYQGIDIADIDLEFGPRLQRASGIIEASTPSDPNADSSGGNDDDPLTDPNNNAPEPASNLRVTRYSAADAELFWDRALEAGLQYEVYRDGELISTQFGISYYDSRRPLNTGSSYVVNAIRSDGSRSENRTVTLEPVGDGNNNTEPENGPEPAANLRVVRYSKKDAELFWDRATEQSLQYEVYRDGVLLRTGFAISFFDNTLAENAGATYDVITIRSDGSRASASTVILAGQGMQMQSTTAAPQDSRLAIYSTTAAELFWTRAKPSENIVRTEVTRDGVLLGDSPGNSFYDDTRVPDVDYVYSLVAIDNTGGRSEPVLVD